MAQASDRGDKILLREVLIYTPDPTKMLGFYADALGLEITHREGEEMVWLAAPGDGKEDQSRISLFLHKTSDHNSRPGGNVQLVFQVNGIHETFTRIQQRGFTTKSAPKEQPYGLIEAAVEDPDGNTVWLVEPT